MSSDASEAAAALARAKWANIAPEDRTEGAKKAAAARWAGHEKKAQKRHTRRKKPSR